MSVYQIYLISEKLQQQKHLPQAWATDRLTNTAVWRCTNNLNTGLTPISMTMHIFPP